MQGLHGVSTVHESSPLMHQAISMVLRLWGFARKLVLFKTYAPCWFFSFPDMKFQFL